MLLAMWKWMKRAKNANQVDIGAVLFCNLWPDPDYIKLIIIAFTALLSFLLTYDIRWTYRWSILITLRQQHTATTNDSRRSCVYAFPSFVIQILILEMLILFVTTQRNCGTFTFTTPTWISLELNELKLWHRSSVTLVYFRVTSTLNTLFYILNSEFSLHDNVITNFLPE